MRRKPFYQQLEWRMIGAMVAIAVGLTVWHHRAEAARRVSLPDRAAGAVLAPIQQSVTAGWDELSLSATGLLEGRELAEENQRLRDQCARLEATIVLRQNESLDNREMRAALGFGAREAPEGIPARVVGRSGSRRDRRTIDVVTGGGREIRKDDIVRTQCGLVGRVQSAMGSRARVITLLDPDTGGAVVVKPSNATGAIHGPDPASPDPDLLRLVYLDPNASIAQGEKVFTSEIGEIYPKGIPVGEVEEVIGRPGAAQTKTALVRPYVDFNNLNYVIVVRPQY
jgi:rod shape-determining protein MreC